MTDEAQPTSADGAPPIDELPIALCGFMGVGKSSIGRRVARALSRPFFDTDVIVVDRLGLPIDELFARGDERLFRQTEGAVIAELVEARPAPVIALGGGALLRRSTRQLLMDKTVLVHLYQPWDELKDVIPTLRRGRPLLDTHNLDEIHELFVQREEVYSVAHVTVAGRRDGVDAACQAVLAALRQRGAMAGAEGQ